MTEARTKRSNQATIRALWEAFGELKSIALKSGKVNDCSKNKVAAKIGISKAYLTGNKKVISEETNQSFLELGQAIEQFRTEFKASKITNKQIDIVKALQLENINLKSEIHKSFMRAHASIATVDRLKRRVDDLEKRNYGLQGELNEMQMLLSKDTGHNHVFTIKRSPKVVIDTNSYRFRDKYGRLQLEDAYLDAYDKLLKEVAKPFKKRLYITVGLPGSGKSTWIENFKFPQDRHSIIFDALNLSIKDRRGIFQRVSSTSDLEIVWVVFLTEINLIRERNLDVHDSSLQITDAELRAFEACYELPEVSKEVWIKEIRYERSQNGN